MKVVFLNHPLLLVFSISLRFLSSTILWSLWPKATTDYYILTLSVNSIFTVINPLICPIQNFCLVIFDILQKSSGLLVLPFQKTPGRTLHPVRTGTSLSYIKNASSDILILIEWPEANFITMSTFIS